MKKNILRNRHSNDEFDGYESENRQKFRHEKKRNKDGKEKIHRVIYDTQNFKCRQCGAFVSPDRELAGVNNRNHCPLCLWSRHVDLHTAGDRLADCGSRMEPVGLTVKQINKRYGRNWPGELMLVHVCTGCGKISINRIAADDDAHRLFQLFIESDKMEDLLKIRLEREGIFLLGQGAYSIVYSQLFGGGRAVESPEMEELCHEAEKRIQFEDGEIFPDTQK
ncbi:RNHCP domain-containing protein [Leptolinea tardivitalis]|uniref:RNHCP domain-containing protein n=1 Tax=Leptolinea tardivitalis TaxID=229920 RepID=UPI000780981E|nr:RNHCP domain-containing protein [Leptolinea tardivitalis]GAP21705.1 protein containing RNHCP domain [Leptolinea tardivitalis]